MNEKKEMMQKGELEEGKLPKEGLRRGRERTGMGSEGKGRCTK